MLILQSKNAKPTKVDPAISAALEGIDRDWLHQVVKRISIPRHYEAQRDNNCDVAMWIESKFKSWGYQVVRQGSFDNLIAGPAGIDLKSFKPTVLVGAHYDSKPETPGADDNGSAVAAMLGCAKAMAGLSQNAANNCVFVAFNREEDGLIGSYDFCDNYLPDSWPLKEVHILEMVGYCDHTEGAQKLPPNLPIKLSHSKGDFLALIANRHSNSLVKPILQSAQTYVPGFPVWGLKVFFGLEKRFDDLRRSDHAPFWDKKIPAFMWTDTSEFRNPNYHQPSDTPDTLDYEFLQKVTQVLLARVAAQS